MTEEQEFQAPGTMKREFLSMGASSLRWIAWSAALGVVASVAGYTGGVICMLLFALLPGGFILCCAAVHLVALVVLTALWHPLVRESLPIFFGMVTFAGVTLGGSLYVAPLVNEWQVESMQSSAVDAVERHRQRTGTLPPSTEAPEGLPDGVHYARAMDVNGSDEGNGYTLIIKDRFSMFGSWWFDSNTGTWTYMDD